MAAGAFRLRIEGALSGLASGLPSGATPEAILAGSPDASVERASLTYGDDGAARRAVTLLARQTGSSPEAIATALGQQATQSLRRAGYSRIAREAGAAITALLTRFGRIRIAVPEGPLTRFAGLGGTATPGVLERAGVTVAPVDP